MNVTISSKIKLPNRDRITPLFKRKMQRFKWKLNDKNIHIRFVPIYEREGNTVKCNISVKDLSLFISSKHASIMEAFYDCMDKLKQQIIKQKRFQQEMMFDRKKVKAFM